MTSIREVRGLFGLHPIVIIAAVVLCLFTFWPAADVDFLWDDDGHVTKPELLEEGGLSRIWFEPGATQQYYPLLHTAFYIQHGVFGYDDARGYRFVNVVLHGLNAFLLLLLLRALRIRGGDLAAMLFLLHPVAVESVAWISELKNLLSGAFFFGALLCWVKFDGLGSDDESTGKRCPGLWTASLVLFCAAVLSKSVTATLPGVVLVLTWWRRGHISLKRQVVPLLPHIVCAIAMGCTTIWVERDFIGAKGEAFSMGVFDRLELAARVPWFYLGQDLWPSSLMFIHPRWELGGAGLLMILLTAGVLGGAYAVRNTVGRWPLAALLLFGGMLFPVLGFLNVYPFRYSFVAEHFQYLARVVVLVVGAAGLCRVADRLELSTMGRWIGVILLALILAFLSRRHVAHFANNEALWTRTIEENPNAWMAYSNLGLHVGAEGRNREAIDWFRRLRDRRPDDHVARLHLGNYLTRVNELDAALVELEEAVKLGPDVVEVWTSYGSTLVAMNRFDEAIAACERALEIDPDFIAAARNISVAWIKKGDLVEGEKAIRRALAIDEADAESSFQLGVVMQDLKRFDAAIAAYRTAIRHDPEYGQCIYYLGKLLQGQNRREEAFEVIEAGVNSNPDDPLLWPLMAEICTETGRSRRAAVAWRKVLAVRPDHGQALAALAWIHATGPDADLIDGGEAVALAERARPMMQESAFFFDALGAALARVRRFDEAVVAATQAQAMLTKAGATDYASKVASRIAAYGRGEAYTASR